MRRANVGWRLRFLSFALRLEEGVGFRQHLFQLALTGQLGRLVAAADAFLVDEDARDLRATQSIKQMQQSQQNRDRFGKEGN